jgi:hypothetical protein
MGKALAETEAHPTYQQREAIRRRDVDGEARTQRCSHNVSRTTISRLLM